MKKETKQDYMPGLPYIASDWLVSHLEANMRIFEYGSGGSTIFLARRTKRVVSVEHDIRWYKRISGILAKEKISNCELLLVPPQKALGATPMQYISVKFGRDTSFENYIKSIAKFPDDYFSLILIDGRARSGCITTSVKKVAKGGFLMLDDSERGRYQEAISSLSKYKRKDFFGHGSRAQFQWKASAWRIA